MKKIISILAFTVLPTIAYSQLPLVDFGNITDSKGELGNVDGDDYWYDNKGNRISGAEYRALSVRKQKKYRAFYANKEVATYFNEIAKAIVNRRYSHSM